MEGPFDAGLINNNPDAHASWDAIARYNGFLASHESLYTGAENITPLAVLLPDDFKPGFAWTDSTPLLDCLSRNSILYAIRLAKSETAESLKASAGIILPWYEGMTPEERRMVSEYAAGGGKVYAFGTSSSPQKGFTEFSNADILQHLGSDKPAQEELIAKVEALAPDTTQVRIETKGHVLANVTEGNNHQSLAIHLLNYDSKTAVNLDIQLSLGKNDRDFAEKSPSLVSPDAPSSHLKDVRWDGSTLRATLPSLKRYSVIVLK